MGILDLRSGRAARYRIAGAHVLLALVGLAPAALAAPTKDDACGRCHGMATLARRGPMGEVVSLAVLPGEFAASEHGRLKCTRCHSRKYRTFPHPRIEERLDCETCHTTAEAELAERQFGRIADEFRKSIHARRHPGEFTCFNCHDPHRFRRWGDVSRQSVAAQNDVCLACHASDAQFALLTPRRARPDVQQAHAWLPHQEAHRRQVRCLDCHTSAEPPVRPHLILPKEQAVRDCVACHSANSVLKATLYRHRRGEETARLGFVNAAIINDAYVIGATRNRLVDRAGSLAVALALFGAVGHGLLRVLAARRRPGGGD
ncbi:MAG: cytochrome c3 family protein [Armatimonadetes bacterium]|nr:cytochrome c3 family protein [Armatimonadota bacterium]